VRNKRRAFARIVAIIILTPMAIWLAVVLYGFAGDDVSVRARPETAIPTKTEIHPDI